MTPAPSPLAAPAPRLLEAVERGNGPAPRGRAPGGDVRIVGPRADGGDARVLLEDVGRGDHVLVLGWIGTHPDAREATLLHLWELEEAARASGAAVLTLRLAPLVGPTSPLMAWLARGPRLGARLARAVMQPVLESDAVEAIRRVLSGQAEWVGTFELCGPEALTLRELADLAASRGPGVYGAAPVCEPAAGILAAQGLSEWEPWAAAFGMTPGAVGVALAPGGAA